MRLRKRPGLYALLAPPPQLLAYVAAPLALSRLGGRYGWHSGRPGRVNQLGLLPLIGGAALITWAITSHYQEAPDEAEMTLIPTYLVRVGAYAHTRNPMYLGGTTMLLGWTSLLGSLPVALWTVVYITGMDRVGIPFEERLLLGKFGDSYDAYRDRVPRWL